jgi:hypothetical protein
MSINVIHFSPTPIVGSPSKISLAQELIGMKSTSIVLSDYPTKTSLADKFIDNSIVLDRADSLILDYVNEALNEANIIHIHNDLPNDKVDWIRKKSKKSTFVYKVHSPLREGPLYYNRADFIGLPFSAYLAIAQYQPRHYPQYQVVPNLVLHRPSIRLRNQGEKLRILFTPAHKRGGRWNSKYSPRLEEVLKSLQELNLVEWIELKQPLHPNQVMLIRRNCHLTIDEIVTGAYHQVSLEGLCAGNIVINRADYFSKAMLANFNDSFSLPPFYYADEKTIDEVLLELATNVDKCRELQILSFEYYKTHLTPDNLVTRYKDIYEKIL